jgi:hypothetical protein
MTNNRQLSFRAEAVDVLEAAEGQEYPAANVLAYRGGLIVVEEWGPSVIDLNGLKAEETTDLTLNHDQSDWSIVGDGKAVNDARSLKIEGRILPVTGAGRLVLGFHKARRKFQASVGLAVAKYKYIAPGTTIEANGRRFTADRLGFTLIQRSYLRHVALLRRGADKGTVVDIAAQAAQENPMDPKLKEWLEAKGFEPDDLSEEQLNPLQAAYTAEQQPPTRPPLPGKDDKKEKSEGDSLQASAPSTDGSSLKTYRELEAAERLRVAEIDKVCKGHPELAAKAIKDDWSVEKAELEVLRASRSQAPAGHVSSGPDFDARVIEAAACRTLNLGVDDDYEPKTLEAADKFFRRGIGLQEMLLLAARANGFDRHVIRLRSETDIKEVLHAAYRPPLQATAYSEANISNILSNVANKSILAAFNAVESAWRKIAKIGSVSDFKTHTRVRLTGDLTYEELGETGEIKHGKIADETTTISAKTYAKMLVLTRNDIINDDLGALDGVRTKIGRGAALKINNVFWTAFLDNSSFFTTARGNLLEGTAYALTATDPIAALDAAVKLFLDQTDPDGDPVAIDPALMLVPTALVGSAGDLYQSTEVRTGGGSTKTRVPTTNRYAGQFEPIVSRYLGNSSYTGYSATAWYLLANPADLPVIEIAFLNGQQAPTVESADADFNMLGIQFRGYHDFGVSKQEYRAGVKVTGAAAS